MIPSMIPKPAYHYARLRVDATEDIGGRGVFANVPISAGLTVVRMIAPQLARELPRGTEHEDSHFILSNGSIYVAPACDAFIHTTRRGVIVDLANRKSGFSVWWFMNHAGSIVPPPTPSDRGRVCMQANVKLYVRKSTTGMVGVEWRAIRDILTHEEIVFDYGCPDPAWPIRTIRTVQQV